MGVFTTLDVRYGYWQVPLAEESKALTTFIMPWGSKQFLRNVMGLISAGDEHNRRGDEVLEDLENVKKITEDVIIYDAEAVPVHEERVWEVLRCCQQAGITLGKKKFAYAQPAALWCGYQLSTEGYTVNPEVEGGLTNFPTWKNCTDVCSFCGLVQQFKAFSADIAEVARPLRSLLSPKIAFMWEGLPQQAFGELIKTLMSPRVLAHYRQGERLRNRCNPVQGSRFHPVARAGGQRYMEHAAMWKSLSHASRVQIFSYRDQAPGLCVGS